MKKLKLSDFELVELKAGRQVTLTTLIKPAPSMLGEPYRFTNGKATGNWYSGQGLMTLSHKCPFGKEGDEHTAGDIPVQVKKVWCALTDTSKPVHWKANPWRFYCTVKKAKVKVVQ